MKQKILILFLFVIANTFAQQKRKTLVTINKEVITVNDFKEVYEKNLDVVDNEDAKNVEKNLDLFINFKLKVAEAYKLKLDTLPSFLKEIAGYKNQLALPYLQDSTYINQLVKEAYFRTKNQIKAKHILIRLQPTATPNDTLFAYNKINSLRQRIVKGEDFEKIAVEASEDPSAKGDPSRGIESNKGNLGFFSAFQMVYPFEDAAYKTKVGTVSEPFRTRFGYHLVQVDSLRPSAGEVEAAHILVKGLTDASKKKIDSVYNLLLTNANFEELAKEVSDDPGSAENGGKLGKFGFGRMVKPFEDAAFSLKNEGDISKPFATRFGYHIIKLIKKHPIASFDDLKDELKNKIQNSALAQMSEQAVVKKLKQKYQISQTALVDTILKSAKIEEDFKNKVKEALFTINNDEKVSLDDFLKYYKFNKNKPVFDVFADFKDKKLIDYYKENLEKEQPAYAKVLNEYKDGLLLFELMQQKIWDKSAKDSIGLQNYFQANLTNYEVKTLDSIKGKVINDYQNHLDKLWIEKLRNNNNISINKKELKKLISYYKKEDE